MVNRTQRIRELNDELRQHLLGGLAVMTPGVAALGQQAVERIVQTISVFDKGLQEIEWVFSATSERWEHACEHLEPQIFLVA